MPNTDVPDPNERNINQLAALVPAAKDVIAACAEKLFQYSAF
jgi:hypothetical protein